MAIDKSEFDVWMKDPVTQDIWKSLTARRNLLQHHLLHDRPFLNLKSVQDYNQSLNVAQINYYKGNVDTLNALININYENFKDNQADQKEEKDAKKNSS